MQWLAGSITEGEDPDPAAGYWADIAPEPQTIAETEAELDVLEAEFRAIYARHGIPYPWGPA